MCPVLYSILHQKLCTFICIYKPELWTHLCQQQLTSPSHNLLILFSSNKWDPHASEFAPMMKESGALLTYSFKYSLRQQETSRKEIANVSSFVCMCVVSSVLVRLCACGWHCGTRWGSSNWRASSRCETFAGATRRITGGVAPIVIGHRQSIVGNRLSTTNYRYRLSCVSTLVVISVNGNLTMCNIIKRILDHPQDSKGLRMSRWARMLFHPVLPPWWPACHPEN